jgi:nifR3 family TIM-barrel protein
MPDVQEPIRPVRLGPLALESNLVLAPMHGHTHLAMRLLCRRFGAALAHTPMVTPEALLLGDPKAARVLAAGLLRRPVLRSGNGKAAAAKDESSRFGCEGWTPADRPLSIQLLPADPGALAEAVRLIADHGAADTVDLNFACPSRRTLRSGRGGAILRQPDLAARLVAAAAGAAHLPVTVKLRTAFGSEGGDAGRAFDVARCAEDAGAVAVTLHARSVVQGYSGRADWDAIAEWSARLAVPVFGSGDLRSAEAILEMLTRTGCAGASVARGALGAPWIFRQAIDLARSGTCSPASMAERRLAVLAHFDGLAEEYGEATAVRLMHKLGSYYARGLRGAAKARAAFQAVRSPEALRAEVERWFHD